MGGESVFEEGGPGDAFYILVAGAVQVYKGDLILATLRAEDADVSHSQVRRCRESAARCRGVAAEQGRHRDAASSPLTPPAARQDDSEKYGGVFFGEMAILDGQPRMAAVRTLGPCRLLLMRADYGRERNGAPRMRSRRGGGRHTRLHGLARDRRASSDCGRPRGGPCARSEGEL